MSVLSPEQPSTVIITADTTSIEISQDALEGFFEDLVALLVYDEMAYIEYEAYMAYTCYLQDVSINWDVTKAEEADNCAMWTMVMEIGGKNVEEVWYY